MKKLLFVVPILVILLGGGLIWALNAPLPNSGADLDLEPLGLDGKEMGQVRHDVTAQMELEAEAKENRVAPAFTRKDDYGTEVNVGPGERPQFVIFIKKGCPCSFDAQPLFNRMAKQFKGKVDFVGVINKGGKDFATQLQIPFPVVTDESLGLMKAYNARASVYQALVARNGHIVKMWPGYSAGWLKEMNSLLAKASGTKEQPFDTQYAPVEKAAGCPFFE